MHRARALITATGRAPVLPRTNNPGRWQERILEVVREHAVDVLALRDGGGLRVEDDRLTVIGDAPARYFPLSGAAPRDVAPGTSPG